MTKIYFKKIIKKKPATNLLEFDDHFQIELLVPGRQKSDFDIKLERNLLTISTSQASSEKGEDHNNFRLREFTIDEFSRSFELSNSIDLEKITATCKNGILAVRLPKKEEAKTLPPRSIEIR